MGERCHQTGRVALRAGPRVRNKSSVGETSFVDLTLLDSKYQALNRGVLISA
jgi:hypothetical protein